MLPANKVRKAGVVKSLVNVKGLAAGGGIVPLAVVLPEVALPAVVFAAVPFAVPLVEAAPLVAFADVVLFALAVAFAAGVCADDPAV